MSNGLPFTVNTPHITSVDPAAGSTGTSVTITGTGFGSAPGTGTVTLGNLNGVVQNADWSDTQIIATVAPSALTGIVRVQQNGMRSNAASFTVTTAGGNSLEPNLLTMLVGDTRPLRALSAGQAVTGLTWASSDGSVVSLTSANPPVLTALAAGHVTITAGTAATDVTVFDAGTLPGGVLPVGTVLWSNPGNGSGVTKIIPAVPSPGGVADVFAVQADDTVQAITSDGTTAWTAVAEQPWGMLPMPDFQGGLVVQTYDASTEIASIRRLDGVTGQPYPMDTTVSRYLLGVHTDGTIFAVVYSDPQKAPMVIGIDPTTGQRKFSAPLEIPEGAPLLGF